MDRLNFFQGLVIALTIAFLSVGGSLLHDAIAHPEQPWSLLGGALPVLACPDAWILFVEAACTSKISLGNLSGRLQLPILKGKCSSQKKIHFTMSNIAPRSGLTSRLV